jgi:hypothetical protein
MSTATGMTQWEDDDGCGQVEDGCGRVQVVGGACGVIFFNCSEPRTDHRGEVIAVHIHPGT